MGSGGAWPLLGPGRESSKGPWSTSVLVSRRVDVRFKTILVGGLDESTVYITWSLLVGWLLRPPPCEEILQILPINVEHLG